jgi:hypothetical protein
MPDTDITRNRRLLLAKQLHSHGLDHSHLRSPLDKMIAVHNFHNAVELTLRAIMLEHEIRTERELNVDFETLLNEFDQFKPFRDRGWRLPYRRELRTLNAVRNLVQHHGHEPEESAMEEWRVFSKRFLTKAFTQYFSVDFKNLSPLDLIGDSRLKNVLRIHRQHIEASDWSGSACVNKYAFELASVSLHTQLPAGDSSWTFFASIRNVRDLGLEELVRKVEARIADVEHYATFLFAGGQPADLMRYKKIHVFVHLTESGKPIFDHSGPEVSEEEACWLHSFVTETIVRWQSSGLTLGVPEWLESGCDEFIEEAKQA